MTRRHAFTLAALLVAASVISVVVLTLPQSPPGGSPTTSPTPTPVTSPPATPTPTPTPKPTPTGGPPPNTVHTADAYRAHYNGAYVGWDRLIEAGKKVPKNSAACRSAWQQARRDPGLNWDKAGYLCLNRLVGRGFKPQGISGSGAIQGYRIAGKPAARRNIVLVTSYSTARQPKLRFPNVPGRTEATRLTVIDLDRSRYNTVELVKPDEDDTFVSLGSHGSGLAWVGQYLYSSSRTALWMYNADDLMQIDGHFVLPAVARWSVAGNGGLSSLGLERTRRETRLISITYSETGTAWSHTFPLDATGLLRRSKQRAADELTLTSSYGPGPDLVHSTASSIVPGSNYQGIGAIGRHRIANSSSLMLDGRRRGDNLVILEKKTRMIARFSMPKENLESLYLDPRRRRYVTITEHGQQFLFWLPVDHLLDRAGVED
ncbi:MAG: hypothetical protein QM650_15150 [Microlunatus sp.]